MNRDDILKELYSMQDLQYREFHKKLVPNVEEDKIIGIRVPMLKKFAKQIAKEKGEEALDMLCKIHCSELYYEERLLAGVLLGNLKLSVEDWKEKILNFVPLINNWGVCDSSCSGMKIVNKNKAEVWDFLEQFIEDDREYYMRFGVVMTMDYYIDEEYIDRTLERLLKVKTDYYYVMMAVAWAISVCFVKFPQKTMEIIKGNKLDEITHNKSIQKIRESNRVDKETKDELLIYKR